MMMVLDELFATFNGHSRVYSESAIRYNSWCLPTNRDKLDAQ